MKGSEANPESRSARGGSPRVFAVVLNWNGLEDTRECLESLRTVAYDNLRTVVVDNGSAGGQADILEQEYGNWITVMRNYENLGYAEGNNVGIRYSLENDADYVLLLNNDIVVAPDLLDKLMAVAESRPDFGIVGPMIYYYPPNRGNEIIWFGGGRVARSMGQPFHIGLNETDQGQYDGARSVDYITGCALLIKRDVIARIGVLDSEYFAYFEDLDWNMRAHAAGFLSVFVPEARIWHKASATSGYMSPTYVYLHTRNRILFVRKNTSKLAVAFVFLPTFLLFRMTRFMITFTLKGQRKAIQALILGFKDGMSSTSIDVRERMRSLRTG